MPMPETVWKMDPHVPQLDRGYVHVYTGDGKGKTTAALGSALRAAGSGLQVAVAAFMRNGDCGEFEMLEQLEAGIQVYYYGSGCFIHGKPARLETIRAHRGCRSIYHLMNSRAVRSSHPGRGQLGCCLPTAKGRSLVGNHSSKPTELEMVITGRYAHPEVIAAADLVTEMKEVKHYYREGIQARPGIDM